jgi:hypothetical protein
MEHCSVVLRYGGLIVVCFALMVCFVEYLGYGAWYCGFSCVLQGMECLGPVFHCELL